MTTATAEMVFDSKRVRSLLGLRKAKALPAPAPKRADERIVYLPSIVDSLSYLRRRTKAPLWLDQEWYDKYQMKARAGYWGVVVPVPDSRDKTVGERLHQVQQDFPGYIRTPMIVDALLLSLELLATGNDLAQNLWIQCPEKAEGYMCFALCVVKGRVRVVRSSASPHAQEPSHYSSVARWICP